MYDAYTYSCCTQDKKWWRTHYMYTSHVNVHTLCKWYYVYIMLVLVFTQSGILLKQVGLRELKEELSDVHQH